MNLPVEIFLVAAELLFSPRQKDLQPSLVKCYPAHGLCMETYLKKSEKYVHENDILFFKIVYCPSILH